MERGAGVERVESVEIGGEERGRCGRIIRRIHSSFVDYIDLTYIELANIDLTYT